MDEEDSNLFDIYHFSHPWSRQPTTHRHGNREEKILDADAFFKRLPSSRYCWCHYSMLKMLKVSFYYHPLLNSFLGLLLCVLVFLSILAIALPLPPPPFLHIIQVQPPARMHTHTDAGMQCCNTKYAHTDTKCREKHIQSQGENGIWLVGFLETPANQTQWSPSRHPPIWLLMKLKYLQQVTCSKQSASSLFSIYLMSKGIWGDVVQHANDWSLKKICLTTLMCPAWLKNCWLVRSLNLAPMKASYIKVWC